METLKKSQQKKTGTASTSNSRVQSSGKGNQKKNAGKKGSSFVPLNIDSDFAHRNQGRTTGRMIDHEPGTTGI